MVNVDSPEKVSASLFNQATATPDLGHSAEGLKDEWSKLNLLAGDQSEMMWAGDRSKWWNSAAIVQAANFVRTTGAPQPLPPVPQDAAFTDTSGPSDDAVEYQGHYYKVFLALGIPWNEAKTACEQLGGHLACPTTQEQVEFISQLKQGKGLWVGGYFDGKAKPATWKWVTGEAFEHRLPPTNSTDLWLSTTTEGQTFAMCAIDGTYRRPDGSVALTDATHVQGYICQWDVAPDDSASH